MGITIGNPLKRNGMKHLARFLFFIVPVFLSAFWASCNSANKNQKSISFKLNLPLGEDYRYVIANEQNIQSMGTDMKLATSLEVNYQKQNDSSGFQLIKSTIGRVVVRVNSPVMNVSFDSKNGDVPKFGQSSLEPMFHLVNKSFLIYLDKQGVIHQIRHLSEPVTPTANDSVLMQTLGKSFDFYPANPVAVGDSWMTTTQLPVQGITTVLKTTYTLASVRDDTAFLDAQAELTAAERNLVMNNVPMTISMNGTQKGSLAVYIPQGRLLKASFSSTITGVFKAQGQEMKSVTTGTSTITSEKE